ncbi:hypothetical protein E3T55_10405 [Cryobacterium frigoriphilum]|uniref:Uncharacterized protein n=1 Tax=Cryobacterium frigoriphilum TaxID=1259150 RepID=A0A4R9A0G8_9MICO|nr:hypothetical protein [Cryobacterium frigoriphilum]TFD49834.1 hypothetical protein E3T55_10405 [Cryobacterium frigoriphilum]
MDWFTLSVVVIVLAGFGMKLARSFRSGPQRRVLERFAREAGLALTPEIEPAVTRRITAHERGYTIGAMTAVVGIGFWSITGTTTEWSGIVLVAIIAIGAVAGVVIVEWRAAFAQVPDQPRIARPTAPAVTDYVSPWEMWASPVVILVAALALGAALAASPLGLWPLVPATVLAAAAVVAAAVSHFAGGALMRRGQPASSVDELAWDDALRGATLRSMVQIPATIGVASLAATLFTLGTLPGLSDVMMWTLFGVLAALVAFMILSNRRAATTYYLRRLWPDLAVEYSDALARGAAS